MPVLLRNADIMLATWRLVGSRCSARRLSAQQPNSVNPTASLFQGRSAAREDAIISGPWHDADANPTLLNSPPRPANWPHCHEGHVRGRAIAIPGMLTALVLFYMIRGMVERWWRGRSGRNPPALQ